MPEGELHNKKRNKNLVMLAAIFGWCALIWVITMVKMSHGG